ncbi:MAG TPA: cytochrome c-type biogenesis protein CcmH [Solirubrobacteraceae bacterium]|nr:cytochrome c-type biogenesis protein CcmH [Solirubrobacteraceae bacterium]
MRTVTAALLAALALALASPASAAEPRTSLPDVEDEVMCVLCNVPLNVADEPQADRQRAFIRRLVDQGLTKDEIKDRLVAEYGDEVLAMPEDDGFGVAAYAVPIAIVLAMLAGAALIVPRWRRREPAAAGTPPAAPAATQAELRRLDEDLARYE